MKLYPGAYLSNKELVHSLNMQIRASVCPAQIVLPKKWIPISQLDKLVANNLGLSNGNTRKSVKIFTVSTKTA